MGIDRRNIKGESTMNVQLTLEEAFVILGKIYKNEAVEPKDLIMFLEFVRKNPDFDISVDPTNQQYPQD